MIQLTKWCSCPQQIIRFLCNFSHHPSKLFSFQSIPPLTPRPSLQPSTMHNADTPLYRAPWSPRSPEFGASYLSLSDNEFKSLSLFDETFSPALQFSLESILADVPNVGMRDAADCNIEDNRLMEDGIMVENSLYSMTRDEGNNIINTPVYSFTDTSMDNSDSYKDTANEYKRNFTFYSDNDNEGIEPQKNNLTTSFDCTYIPLMNDEKSRNIPDMEVPMTHKVVAEAGDSGSTTKAADQLNLSAVEPTESDEWVPEHPKEHVSSYHTSISRITPLLASSTNSHNQHDSCHSHAPKSDQSKRIASPPKPVKSPYASPRFNEDALHYHPRQHTMELLRIQRQFSSSMRPLSTSLPSLKELKALENADKGKYIFDVNKQWRQMKKNEASDLFPFLNKIESMDPSTLAHAVKKAAEQGCLTKPIWLQFKARSLEIASQFTQKDIICFIAGCALARVEDFSVFYMLMHRLDCLMERGIAQFTPQNVHTLIVACGRLQFTDSKLMKSLIPIIMANMTHLTCKHLANIIHAYAKMHLFDEGLLRQSAKVFSVYMSSLKTMAIANIATAYARAAVYEREFIDKLAAEVIARYSQFSAIEMKNFFVAFSAIIYNAGLVHKANYKKCVEVSIIVLNRYCSLLGFMDLLAILESCICFQYFDYRFLNQSLFVHILRKHQIMDNLSLQSYSRLLVCLKRLPDLPSTGVPLLRAAVSAMPKYMDPLEPHLLAEIIGCLDELGCYDFKAFLRIEQCLMSNRKLYYMLSSDELQTCIAAFSKCEPCSRWKDIILLLQRYRQTQLSIKENQPSAQTPIKEKPSPRKKGSVQLYRYSAS